MNMPMLTRTFTGVCLLLLTMLMIPFTASAQSNEGFEYAGRVSEVNLATQSFQIDDQEFRVKPGLRVNYQGDTPLLVNIIAPGMVMTISGEYAGYKKVVHSAYIHHSGEQ